MKYIVALETFEGEPLQFIAPWEGDPGRTCIHDSAQQFESMAEATFALAKAREYRDFETAEILRVDDPDEPTDRIQKALNLIYKSGGIDGAHHKQWLLDQVVRILSDDYQAWVKEHNAGDDGPNTYEWDEGVAP